MVHLGIVARHDAALHALELLCASESVSNVVHLADAASKPPGAKSGVLIGVLISISGALTLYIQRRFYVARRVRHLSDPSRAQVGLPLGQSSRSHGEGTRSKHG